MQSVVSVCTHESVPFLAPMQRYPAGANSRLVPFQSGSHDSADEKKKLLKFVVC